MKLAQLKELDDKYILNTYKRYPLQVVKGEGVYVYDEEGNKYLDFLSGIAVNALGYGNKTLLNAINDQANKLIHISNLFYTELPVLLAKKLCEISEMDKVFFCNSGAEANELAVKLSRANAKYCDQEKNTIICIHNSFHGRTLASLSVTKGPHYADKFAPMMLSANFVTLNDKEELINSVDDKIATIIIEPIQGEGGINVADAQYLKLARKLADKHNALLIFDEVQSGLGRTGKYFAYQFSNVKPDIITLAKPLGAGLPMGAVLLTDKVAKNLTYGDHGSTFGANSLVSAAALTFLKIIEEENLLNNINNVGQYLFEKLSELKDKYSFIKEVRGKGFMLGIELEDPVKELHLEMIKQGLIVNCTSEKVIRLLPPYITTKENVDEAIAIIERVLSDI